MTPEQYSALALRTANNDRPLLHAALGIAGEAGEIADMIKKHEFYGKHLDCTALLLEIGDEVWYINLLLHHLGLTWAQVFEANITKLEKRYPDLRFDADRAINKDSVQEQLSLNLEKPL